MSRLPAIKVEYLIQLRRHCGVRSYAVAGRIHRCGICETELPAPSEPWEIYAPDVTPRIDRTVPK